MSTAGSVSLLSPAAAVGATTAVPGLESAAVPQNVHARGQRGEAGPPLGPLPLVQGGRGGLCPSFQVPLQGVHKRRVQHSGGAMMTLQIWTLRLSGGVRGWRNGGPGGLPLRYGLAGLDELLP